MRRFARLYEELDRTTSTNEKVAALVSYFSSAPPEDAAWAVWFLTGRRLKRFLPGRLLAGWALEEARIPDWLFEDSYSSVGDLAETISLVLDGRGEAVPEGEIPPLARWMEERLLPLRALAPEEQRQRVTGWWRGLPRWETFVLNKLLTGELRVGVSQTLVERALAQVAGVPQPTLAHRLMGTWEPTAAFYEGLLTPGGEEEEDGSRPYPFYLASPLDQPAESLGDPGEWLAEWKWDGIRAQLIRRGGHVHLWSRGEELITERFPELTRGAAALVPDGTVLDGEILAWRGGRDGQVLPFAVLQRRIGRKKLTEKVLAEAPAVFLGFDLLETGGQDVRERPLAERRAGLERLLEPGRPFFLLSPSVEAATWEDLARAREEARGRGVEGLMLKRLSSPYRTGRRRGDWWKWKIDPFTVDAVLLYAQPGHGRRANLLTDYTFAVWSGGELVPIAKAYSGLSDEEILTLDGWIRRHTLEKFGPVRSVEPVQVFELAFEGIALSPRHKSGIAVRFPRIARWRTDKRPDQADTLEGIRRLLDPHSPDPPLPSRLPPAGERGES
ncbi:MAG TPA: ATP-dependent DNA ligase [Thermoanaerobaculia bacterium]|nr:ATP-dependent DNA ligase [Thermoanaerobaculia bacterium]